MDESVQFFLPISVTLGYRLEGLRDLTGLRAQHDTVMGLTVVPTALRMLIEDC